MKYSDRLKIYAKRREMIRRLYQQGIPAVQIAKAHNISRQRVLQLVKQP